MLHIVSLSLSLILLANFGHCAEVNFKVSLATPNLDVDCTFKMGKNEKFDQAKINKDGQTFISFNGDNRDNPVFTKIDGISDVNMKGGGQLTINKYQDSTFGVYQCIVFYKLNNKDKAVSKKLSLKLQAGKCKPEWKKATVSTLPSNIFVAGKDAQGKTYYFCRFTFEDTVTPGYVSADQGCIISWNGGTKTSAEFEALAGSGFEWGSQANGGGTPLNSHQAGQDSDKDNPRAIYAGRCQGDGDTRIGKIDFSSKMYYAVGGTSERSGCSDPHEILICNQG